MTPENYEKPEKKGMARFVVIALGGSSIEWYNFFLYATASVVVFPALFFPPDIPAYVALIASFSTFAVGFVARPIGAIVFGNFGDRVGRKAAFVVVLSLTGFATTIIGLLPTYAEIGVIAPLALVLCRFAQGLAIGGYWGGAVLLLTESAPANKRGFYGAFAQAGVPIGLVLANLAFFAVSLNTSDEAFMVWGWRCPFVFNFALIGLALYAKFQLEETLSFQTLEAPDPQELRFRSGPAPVLQALAKFPREVALSAGAFAAVQVLVYIFITFGFAYATDPGGLAIRRMEMLIVVVVSCAVHVPSLFFFAAYSDRHGRFNVFRLGIVLLAIMAFVAFPLLETRSVLFIAIGFSIGQIFIAMVYGPYPALLTELFSAEVRYSGAALSYQLAAMLGGALAPVIATLIFTTTGGTIWISAYAALACIASWCCLQGLQRIQPQDHHMIADGCYDGPGVK
jgi:MFS family permease